MSYARFAIFYVPPNGLFSAFGAGWLGWDIVQGAEVGQLDLPGLTEITMAPRKYGFHGTLKSPFRLADGFTAAALGRAVSDVAAGLAPGKCDGLALTPMGRFLALTPQGDASDLGRVADACVRHLDGFRAPPNTTEQARRRKGGLNPRQEALLAEWGYPYVMDQFRFHMTLSARLAKGDIPIWVGILQRHLPQLPAPFVIDQIALCGEREDGRFEMIERYALAG